MTRSVKLVSTGFKLYHAIRGPHLPSCRFVPTCSHYALEALENHGFVKGLFLFFKRLGRCHPWGGWGIDPVPVSAQTLRRNRSNKQ